MVGRKTVLGIFFLVLAYYFGRGTRKIDGVTVGTTLGNVKGVISLSRDGREYYEWLGIPYAKAPVGDLRYASPQPAEPWTGVRDATELGPECAQVDLIQRNIKGSEDCLHLNVHVPKKVPKGKLLPVLVWIHGGYFVAGSSRMYRPNYFMDFDVVVVTLNYRLGALGFLNAGHKSARGNMGLKDQALAIKWVSENAERFGGDPKKLMIFGESAGGASVHLQLLYPKNEGLISSAVSQSGCGFNEFALYEDPIGQAQDYARNVNCPTEDAGQMVECLKKADLATLLDAHQNTLEPIHPKSVIFVPTIESIVDQETFLSQHPAKLVKSGNFVRVPWLNGFTKDEGLILSYHYVANETFRQESRSNWAEFAEDVMILSPELKAKSESIRDFYLGKPKIRDQEDDSAAPFDMDDFRGLRDALTDRFFVNGITRASLSAARFAPVYVYEYNKKGPSFMSLLSNLQYKYPLLLEVLFIRGKSWINQNVLGHEEPDLGISHADDLPMAWLMPGVFNIPKGDPNYKFSKDFVQLFVDFANDHSNAKMRGVGLHRQQAEKPIQVLEISDKPVVRELSSVQKKRLEFWTNLEKNTL